METNFKAKRELKHELQKTYIQIKAIINDFILAYTYLEQMETIYPHDSKKEQSLKQDIHTQRSVDVK